MLLIFKSNIVFLLILIPSVFYGQRFAIISDIHGASSNTLDVSNLVKSWNPEFVITCGDNFYPLVDSIDHQVGQFYQEFISPYTGIYGPGDTINRFFPSLGNHDNEGSGLSQYLSYFTLPGNERYYDFVNGDIHFFAINSTATEPDGTADTSVQAQWLKNKLAQSTSIYNIVYFHYPPFSSGLHGNTPQMQWPFKLWGASAVFSGHDHDYERIIINGFPYFVNGAGGGTAYTVYNAVPGSIKHYSYKHGAILAEANSDSITFKFINIDDSLVDRYSIKNNQTGYNSEFNSGCTESFHCYPNPVANSLNITFNNTKGQNIEIINIVGDVLYKSCPKKIITINTENWANGMYIIRCGPASKKIIIEH